MLKPSCEKPNNSINLLGPEGNAFFILGLASSYAKEFDMNTEAILKEMQSADYKHLVLTFDKYFGEYITIYGSEVLDV